MFKDALEKVIQRENLSAKEASFLMEEIMMGHLTPAQMGALLVALRMKGETVEEIAGFATVMRKMVREIHTHHPIVVDTCGTGGDGLKTFNISTTAAFVVAGAGVPVAKHGNVAVSSACGSADLLKGLGIKIDADRSLMEKALNDLGICFLFAPLFHHAMKHVATPRRELGIRTVFNILGPLTNPARAKAQVLGVSRKDLVSTLAQVLMKLGSEQAFVVYGEDGSDEVTTTSLTHVAQLKEGHVRYFEFNPEELGIARASLSDLQGGDLQTNVKISQNILEGQKGPPRDVVLVNAAFAILAGNGALDLKEAFQKAQEAIDSGKAKQKLEELAKYTC
ncbi:MAG: anthranilate phosphoribosyltransferase [Chlamydiae bacterium]|nr:anthranilate phosphoribosyltransferase [Chlamydiota bacterium]MBI3266003.1 anthranilate phosphoribosyltransferase [Chlamydiota bacterium]